VGFTRQPIPWLPIGGALAIGLIAAGLFAARTMPVGRVRGLGDASEVAISVSRSGLTIGGAKGNGLVLADPRVSRSHAVIRLERGRVMLVDLKSANGTKVNGRPVNSVALRSGDRILVADAIELLWEEGFRFGKGR
jgi:pSer/pThr/pTyr-binding forkhead associated (FHA) protein